PRAIPAASPARRVGACGARAGEWRPQPRRHVLVHVAAMTAREPLGAVSLAAPDWRERNLAHLHAHAHRIRLLVARRIAWLRTRWAQDPLKSYGTAVVSDQAADALLSPADAEAEAAFYASDANAQALTQALAAAEDAIAAEERAMEDSGAWPALTALARTFALSAFERDTVALCVAPELDPDLETLYAYVQNDAARRYPTPALAAALFGMPHALGIAAFAAHAPLRRLQLIACDGSGASALAARPLRISERVLGFLLGEIHIDARVQAWLRPIAPVPLPADHEALAVKLAEALAADPRTHALGLAGPPRSGKRALARALAGRLGL